MKKAEVKSPEMATAGRVILTNQFSEQEKIEDNNEMNEVLRKIRMGSKTGMVVKSRKSSKFAEPNNHGVYFEPLYNYYYGESLIEYLPNRDSVLFKKYAEKRLCAYTILRYGF